jgi:succinate dehydrogenase / fumarate reductase cytochrome b subunit
MSITSILHRLSGVFLACLIPIFLFLLHYSLRSKEHFLLLQGYFAHPLSKLIIWGCLSSLIYHLFAGVRHMVMDIGIGEDVASAKLTSMILLIVTALAVVGLGVWIWR